MDPLRTDVGSASYHSSCQVVTPKKCNSSSSNRVKIGSGSLLQRTILPLTVICLIAISILPNVLAMTQEEKNELR
jgi:hypothetical protein